MAIVQRLQARVVLDDPAPTLARAMEHADRGDESWARWVSEYWEGKAIIVRLEVSLELSDGEADLIEQANDGVFLETDPQPPKVEQQVAEVVSKDYSALARELDARGHPLARDELHTMYVHVELGDDVRRSLANPAVQAAGHADGEKLTARPSQDAP